MMISDTNFRSFDGGTYQPSFDFDLFELPQFSSLMANEFGAETSFRANTPTPYVDFSLNQLLSILNTPNESPFPTRAYPESNELENLLSFFSSRNQLPFPQAPSYASGFQGAEDIRERLRRVRDEANRVLGEAGGTTASDITCPAGEVPYTDILGRRKCGKPMISDGKGTMGDVPNMPSKKTTDRIEGFFSIFDKLPQGAGIFLIGIVAVIFLLLFARK